MRTHLLLIALLGACSVEPAEPALEPVGGAGGAKGDGVCPRVPASIAPTAAPPFACGPAGQLAESLWSPLNAFWGSQIGLCTCGPDYDSPCVGASSRFELGWVYLQPGFLEQLTSAAGSPTPAAYALAHEVGHELQGHYGIDGRLIQLELGADCLAGYYLGSLACERGLTERDIVTTLATACVIADGTGDPVRDLDTHGTCEQRMSAVSRGIAAYEERKAPLEACRF